MEQKYIIKSQYLKLKEHYKENGLCKECKQSNTSYNWCQLYNINHFQQNSKKLDKWKFRQWIEYDKFEDIEYIAKGGFG
ncbi:hypothetical protein C1646_762690 [Rhizophagus diaphanus]|nr:hypothetical protein C1646_762690 [Rhizophagus diaphanus] [Rhizophagus sp. MUCL 43196]